MRFRANLPSTRMQPPPTAANCRRRSRPSPFVIILLLGILLHLPSFQFGFLLDDYLLLGIIEGDFAAWGTERSPFSFFVGDAEETARIASVGGYPWWIDDGIKIKGARPLSQWLLRVDLALSGRTAPGYHLHSLLWWLAALWVCGLVLRRALPGGTGTLALLLFALDAGHVLPAGWIANRNALVALTPVLLALWAHIRWREEGWRTGRLVAGAGMIIGLLGGELAVAAISYLVAYELFGAPVRGMRDRAAGLAPIAILVAAYLLIYRLLGYGAAGSGLYIDPGQDPIGYLAAAATRIPALLAGGIAGFSADFWYFAPATRPVLIAVGSVAALGLLALIRSLWSRLDEPIRRGLRWLLAGSALSLPVVATTFPADRMLLVPGIGLLAAVAAVLNQAWRSRRARRRWWLIAPAGLLAAIHLALAPFFALLIQAAVSQQSHASLNLASSPAVREAQGKETVILLAPDHVVGLYLPLIVHHLAGPAPLSWRPLSLAPYDHRLRRSGPMTLELEVVEGGVMMRSIFEELYRDRRHPLLPGASLDRGLFRAEILAGTDAGPTCVAFHFDRDLDDPSLRFLIWLDGELKRAILPAVGDETIITRTLGPAGF
jgi:hypothetical protein